MLAKVGHLHVFQMALVDQVMCRNGIAKKNVGLVKGHCIQGVLKGRVGVDLRPGVAGLDLGARQVVVDHAHTQSGEIAHH
ncbi:hypothetical protein D3C76_1538990 [compost metagenome]